ncbi:hypothetical protein [Modestobacter roseus]|uniref:Uncharacterized protein n=1 Tax=Modestobacter roseus TaxID=1181884 RepID=A0A562IRX0_9ACTN|nr:hypothetical protein [Modestobacter roseus]MQA36013.1 hypothetical protein [Modestobacter roseus]TWH73600.1 hypothetical protein JD78_02124 [Modestobacter roseus]
MRGIVVIDQPVEDRVVGWHVNVGEGLESTMAGAWVLPSDDDRIARLLVGRIMVPTEKASVRFGRGADAAALAVAIVAETSALDAAFAAHVASLPSSKRSLVSPRWPRIPTRPRPETAGDPLASDALTLARWVAELLTAWDRIEKERLTRPFLAVRGGEATRALPPGWPAVSCLAQAA